MQSHDRSVIEKPLVSVVVICFNQAKYIEATIRSVVDQTYASIEVIVADDCSSDATPKLAEEILKNSRLNYLVLRSEINRGITDNTNRALSRVTGSYIAYLGGDDVWDAKKIETAVACLEAKKEASMFAHGMRYINSEGIATGGSQTPSQSLTLVGAKDVFSGECRFLGSSAVVRNVKGMPLYDVRMPVASDLLYFVELIQELGPAVVSPEIMGSYRVHGQSVSKTRRSQIVQDGLISLAIVESRYPELCRVAAKRRRKILYGLGIDGYKSNDRQRAANYFLTGFLVKPHLKSFFRFIGLIFR